MKRRNILMMMVLPLGMIFCPAKLSKANYTPEVSFAGGGGANSIFDAFDVDVWLYRGMGEPRSATIFDSVIITSADVGSTYLATSSSDTGFNDVVSWLTNGIEDRFMLFFFYISPGYGSGIGGSGIGRGETDIFAGVTLNGTDLGGYDIEAIAMRVESLWFDSPGSNPNGDGIWTDFGYDLTFTFIPEPATILLVGLGAVVLRKKLRA